MSRRRDRTRTGIRWIAAILVLGTLAMPALPISAASEGEDAAIAASLAEMLRSARRVISNSQDRINDPALGDKGLSGKVVLAQAIDLYRKTTGTDPMAVDPASRHGRLLRAQMDAIVEVTDDSQDTINAKGVGFKAFIPAVFARMVNEAFERRESAAALIKVTAPEDLVRNRKARPDDWEQEIIRTRLLTAQWPHGKAYETVTDVGGRPAFRTLIPEYYTASCLSCHGSPKGEMDITGYPKEGGREGDLGAAISITLFR